ncbi:class I SAM-dependent methyltransferase [Fulvivirga sp. 29W222]|uniref:Class I SAM-dependent methyltransferase n=1 Tax=Fulvivirga marina TaxID=2494733 RepID=A0A937KAS9_9BACT|nr:class I SAM-dependent methyltransferase [Fulvivirga marina]MBL6445007.1 class I SAM-dependent methyltransferase [Fulvivirga marina]
MRSLTLFALLFALFSCKPEKRIENNIKAEVLKDTLSANTQSGSERDTFDMNSFQNLVKDYEDPERSEWQNPSLIIDKLGDVNDKVIADIGAGTGYFTFRLAGKGAHVIAIDIDERFLNYIEDRKPELQHIIPEERIETRLSLEDDPLLNKDEVHIAILVNTYHFLSDRVKYLQKIKRGLKNNSRLIIVDYKLGQMPVGPPENIKITSQKVSEELQKAGFKSIEIDNTSLEFQYIISAKRI